VRRRRPRTPHAIAGRPRNRRRKPRRRKSSPASNGVAEPPIVVSPTAPTLSWTQNQTLLGLDPSQEARDPPLSRPAVERFHIIRAFSRGGLGQVSLARDQELNREVALKEILPKHADSDEARQRFLMEAEITGSLEHPGIVPVYGLGQYGDGRPFYAMRFIRGDNLQSAIDEFHTSPLTDGRELRFRHLLGRFIDVCNAIEYAHNRCVLHRDLKPGNIMLGKYGETLVVDWGLAKTIGEDSGADYYEEQPVRPAAAEQSAATQLGRVVGTPAYMSPEQASGRIDLLGPATDIYALGATLYHLLTGTAPFSFASSESILANVQMGLFRTPRNVKPNVPRALEAVCLKAMARRADERYASARAVADDIERYLADEPVAAYREPISARMWRFLKRHRAAALSSAAVLAVIVVALAIGVVLLDAANRREQRLRGVADAEWKRAEQNFEMARNAVRDYYVTVSEDTLLDQPGMQPLRGLLLRQALSYYQQFLEQGEQEGALGEEMAQANYFVGRITETLESPAQAIPYYEKADKMNGDLVAASPEDEDRLYAQARTLNALGGALQKLQRWEESKRYYRQAEVVRRRLVDAHPGNVEYVRTLANTIMNLGSIDAASGDDQASVARMQDAQKLRLDRLDAGEDDPALRADAGIGYFNLGLYHYGLTEDEEAAKYFKQAAELFEKVRQQAPNDLNSQRRLAMSYRTLGDVRAEAEGGAAEAHEYYDKADELLATLSLRNPQVREYKADLGGMQLRVAELWNKEKKPSEALAALDKARHLLEPLVEENPDVSLYQRDLAVALRMSGEIRAARDDRATATVELQRAVALLEKLTAADPDDNDFRDQLDLAKAALQPATPGAN
jgi:serine/threonine-protein kinase